MQKGLSFSSTVGMPDDKMVYDELTNTVHLSITNFNKYFIGIWLNSSVPLDLAFEFIHRETTKHLNRQIDHSCKKALKSLNIL